MKKLKILLAVCFLSLSVNAHEMGKGQVQDKGGGMQINACDFRSDMRKLWEDHVTWTRIFIISTLADLPDNDSATKRLLQNQKDIGNAIVPFYGIAAGTKLTNLLTEHILIAADIVAAAKSGNMTKVNSANKKWFDNADEIALFLHNANPKNWSLADMKMMMHHHLELTTEELMARLQHDWAADVVAYDKVHTKILEMSDDLAAGIIKQFGSH